MIDMADYYCDRYVSVKCLDGSCERLYCDKAIDILTDCRDCSEVKYATCMLCVHQFECDGGD